MPKACEVYNKFRAKRERLQPRPLRSTPLFMSGKKLPKSGKVLPMGTDGPPLVETLQNGTGFLFFSGAMRQLRRLAAQVASSDASVLIHGETGTGKELFARLIHEMGVRERKPFVAVNCGVHAGELFADKFFGHEQGAFTGAHRLSQGCFELAEDGTLFLDEAGEIPPANQADFLRVLEERKFRRIGGQRDIPFNARIVAASNRELPEMVREGRFRADLFFRLNVIPVSLPPLRARQEAIVPMAKHFLDHYAAKYHRPGMQLSPCAEAALVAYAWPGNVRELKNLVERLVLLAPEGPVDAAQLPPEVRMYAGGTRDAQGVAGGRAAGGHWDAQAADGTQGAGLAGARGAGAYDAGQVPYGAGGAEADAQDLSLERARQEAEVRVILRALRLANGHKGETARLLGVSPRTLRYKFAEYGLKG